MPGAKPWNQLGRHGTGHVGSLMSRGTKVPRSDHFVLSCFVFCSRRLNKNSLEEIVP